MCLTGIRSRFIFTGLLSYIDADANQEGLSSYPEFPTTIIGHQETAEVGIEHEFEDGNLGDRYYWRNCRKTFDLFVYEWTYWFCKGLGQFGNRHCKCGDYN
jgi:hypothetical protein